MTTPPTSSFLRSDADSIEVTSCLPLDQPLVEVVRDADEGGTVVIEHLKAIAEAQSVPHMADLLVEALSQYFIMCPARANNRKEKIYNNLGMQII